MTDNNKDKPNINLDRLKSEITHLEEQLQAKTNTSAEVDIIMTKLTTAIAEYEYCFYHQKPK